MLRAAPITAPFRAATRSGVKPVACPRQLTVRCRASGTEQQQQESAPATPPTPVPPTPTPQQVAEANKPLILQQGQGTAIVTGAISIILGLAYFVLVFMLDSRGGEMLPPPPEAFGP
mmetsp:Transcript_8911/g.22047  ORF Transcript_8911/g.22047 Transcript_8911/m.22047 type:complete len:117 (-) Transcript_8911:344-694(-)|eukprot:CAMPEP_0202865444 /NCGR_PEP_ID=MMETSP1391-20130828/6019_1 /ASSEMBLY_ACC=CAM_ASM_000867 /TAXON_ID=1034604 /ORGANISM="Chlamydomonas leiostraca, Strain SAG 11-49" /LENGTH=116 /DNA_ID=CAMNT_0049545289 /DNA_START=26 /DNA_END=376 /DNA_ORIENTATION=+